MKRRGVLALGLIAPLSRAGAATCAPRAAAALPLRDDGGYLSVPAAIDGREVSLIVDTGSEGSLLTPEATARLRLPADPARRTEIRGSGGAARLARNVRVADLRLGGLDLGPGSVPEGTLPGAPMIDPPISGLLGMDALGGFDLDFDLPEGKLTLWRPPAGPACRTVSLPPGRWAALPVRRLGDATAGGRLAIAFTLDGRDGTALIDSGARAHVLGTPFAARLGVTARQLARDPGGTESGMDLRERIYHWHRFGRLTLGPLRWEKPVLTVAPLDEQVDMLLGADWFAGRRVWLSPSAGAAFLRVG